VRSNWVLMAGALALLCWSAGVVAWLAVPDAAVAARSRAALPLSASTAAHVPIAALELRSVDGGLLLSGELPNAAAVAELLSKARTTYAPLAVQDGLRVRPEAGQAMWLGEALAGLPLPMPGVERPEWLWSAEGLRIGGTAADATARDAVRAQLAQRFPSVHLSEQLQVANAAPVTVSSPVVTPESRPASALPAVTSPASPHPQQSAVDALLAARPVVFASGSTRLQRGAGPDWKALVARIEAAGPTQVQVRGHTDDRGRADSNRRLSARRAEAVKQALVRAGLPAASIRVDGVGAVEPVASNTTAAGRRQNRRIEIRLVAEADR
jgi:outer membrane protein OmpA-like peptidoglycan-associated protein